jgi:hypothetical protein
MNDGFARGLPGRIIQTKGPIDDHLLSLSIKPNSPHGSTAAVKGRSAERRLMALTGGANHPQACRLLK